MRFIKLTFALLSTLLFSQQVAAHSKLYCTKLILDGNGNIDHCEGAPPSGSTYEHIWGFSNIDNKVSILRGLNLPDQYLLEDVVARRRTMCTGQTPPADKIAQVRPGETYNYLWSLNGHDFDNQMKWEGRGVQPNQAEPSYQDWVNSRQIGRNTYRDNPGSATRCANFAKDLNDGSRLSDIMRGQPEVNEFRMCWGPYTIPNDMPAGLNRILYEWNHPPNDAHFYDCAWVNVIRNDNGGNNGNNGNGLQRYVPAGEDPKLVNPLVFDVNYYNSRYGDLNNAFHGDYANLVQHWYQFGMRECRDSSPNFAVGYYLNAWSDLKRAFGDDCRAAVNHYIDFGNREGRQTVPNGGGIRAQSAGPAELDTMKTIPTMIHDITLISGKNYRSTIRFDDITATAWTLTIVMNQAIATVTSTGVTASASANTITLKSTTTAPSNVMFTFTLPAAANTTSDLTGSQPWPLSATFNSGPDSTTAQAVTLLAQRDVVTSTNSNGKTTNGATTMVSSMAFITAVVSSLWAAIRQ